MSIEKSQRKSQLLLWAIQHPQCTSVRLKNLVRLSGLDHLNVGVCLASLSFMIEALDAEADCDLAVIRIIIESAIDSLRPFLHVELNLMTDFICDLLELLICCSLLLLRHEEHWQSADISTALQWFQDLYSEFDCSRNLSMSYDHIEAILNAETREEVVEVSCFWCLFLDLIHNSSQ